MQLHVHLRHKTSVLSVHLHVMGFCSNLNLINVVNCLNFVDARRHKFGGENMHL